MIGPEIRVISCSLLAMAFFIFTGTYLDLSQIRSDFRSLRGEHKIRIGILLEKWLN